MKVPKYIRKLIGRRAKLAVDLCTADSDLVNWLEKHDILDNIEPYDHTSGCEMYVNPWASAQRILEAIENK